jgi:beta-glucosidase
MGENTMFFNKNTVCRLILFLFPLFSFFSCSNGTTDTQRELQGEIPIPAVSSTDSAIIPLSRTFFMPASSEWWADRHNKRINNIKRNQKIIFIGDSITLHWEYEGLQAWTALNQKYDTKIINLGFGGDETQHVIWRLENGEFPYGINPEYVVLMIGTNNRHEPESIAAGIGKIVKIINSNSPSTNIILLSILPRGAGNGDTNTVRNNAVNDITKKYDGYLGIQYLDIGQYYIDTQGNLKEELFTDRLHLTSTGYNIMGKKLMEIIK